MNSEEENIAVGIQLGLSVLLMLVTTLIHGLGLVGIAKGLNLRDDRLEKQAFNIKALWLMCMMGVALFALHTLEIWIFALIFLLMGALGDFESALYYSASSYATLGIASDFPKPWRIFGTGQSLIGFLMISWSTAFIVRNFNKLRE